MNIRASIRMPHNEWMARPHQMKLWAYLARGGKRAVAIWHRRAGKDEVALHHTATQMMAGKAANFWHVLPMYEQARKAIWTSVNAHTGKRRIDEVFPLELRSNTDESKMFIRMINGSTWSCLGSDNYSSVVGAGPAGIVFSEYALSNPSAWAYMRPMLEENNGWAVFITTPRGHNHAKTMYEYAQHTPGWFAQLLTARDTGALTNTQLDEALQEMRSIYGADHGEAAFMQEYMCSFNALNVGSFYAREMEDVRKEGRLLDNVDALPDRSVHRAWDLGVRDSTAIWFFQAQGSQIVLLDFYQASGVGVEHYADMIQDKHKQHGWKHGTDYVPHDAKVREFGSGRTRVETMSGLGLAPFLVPDHKILDGINAVRRTLALCVFHTRTEGGIAALEQYRREYDDEKKCFKPSPLHDWTSDGADAFRYLAMGYKPAPLRRIPEPVMDGWRIPPPPDYKRSKGIIL